MTEVSRRTLIFSIIFILFFTVFPTFFGSTLSFFPLVQKADLIEFISCFFVIPAYWYLFEVAGKGRANKIHTFLFILSTTLLAVGVGLHLASNAIQHLIESSKGTPGFKLAYFLHKPFSHYAIEIALIALSSILIVREHKTPWDTSHSLMPETISAALYGFAFFGFTVSGKVAPLGILFSMGLLIFSITRAQKLRRLPVLAFFALSYLWFLCLTAGWALYWKGLPNFDETGIL